ncbi:MAG: Gldg family protein [Gammaproteobacteria bacterium]|nr:Gldg family protein [Gammaproteobacteria bacterium]
MTSRMMTTTGVVLAVVLLFAVNILASRLLGPARIDLTEHRLFTLSEGTRGILTSLDEPVTLRFYLSRRELERVPGIGGYADRVRALLEEYGRIAGGKLTLHVIDPEPFSEEEDRAVGYGLRGVPLGLDEGIFYFGLAGTNSVDDEEIIPFFAAEREQFLEYDVTKLVHNLSNPKQKVVGLLSSLPVEGQGPQMQAVMGGMGAQPWMVVDQIRQLFELRSLPPTLEEIPEDVDVLMLVHPQSLSRDSLYAIDQYVLRGGRVVAFIDPYSETQQDAMAAGFMPPAASRRSEIDELLSAWGVTLGEDVVADLALALKVRMEQGGRILTFDYPVWMNITPQTFDHEDIVTGDLANLGFGTAGYLEPADGATTTFTPLVTTTPGAAQFTPEQIAAVTTDPRDLLDDYTSQDRAYTVIARISGKVGTAFPDGRPLPEHSEDGDSSETAEADDEAEGETEPKAEHLSESTEDAQIILVADADMLADRLWVVVQEFLGSRIAIPSAANGTLVINALDNLTGSGDLISVRNRGTFTRPFTRVAALRQQAERTFRAKEQELIAQLEETERRLVELEESSQGNDALIITDAQREELVKFRQERVRIGKELREVRRQLRADIEALESWLKFANIGLVPILIGLTGLVAGLLQLRRRRATVAAPA